MGWPCPRVPAYTRPHLQQLWRHLSRLPWLLLLLLLLHLLLLLLRLLQWRWRLLQGGRLRRLDRGAERAALPQTDSQWPRQTRQRAATRVPLDRQRRRRLGAAAAREPLQRLRRSASLATLLAMLSANALCMYAGHRHPQQRTSAAASPALTAADLPDQLVLFQAALPHPVGQLPFPRPHLRAPPDTR